jgi:hypothetical protein
MFKKTLIAGAVTAALGVPAVVWAQEVGQVDQVAQMTPMKPEAPAAPAADKPMEILGFEFTGYVDVGYQNYSTGSGKFISGTNARVFDFDRNGLNLQNLELQLAKIPENGFGGMLDVTIGKDADTIAAYGTIDKNRGPANGGNKKLDITQLHLHYGAGPFSMIAGKFVTSAGAEVIKSPSNTNFSRGILFGYAIPFTHTGLRATYNVSDTLRLIGGVNQGWDAVKDTNSSKTIELGASINPVKELTLAVMLHNGKEKIVNYPDAARAAALDGTRNLVDIVATYNATDKLTLVLNYDNAYQRNATLLSGATGTAKWEGWAGYVNYMINEQWKVSLRGEWFNDKDGYRTTVQPGATSGQKWKEATITVAYLPVKNVELRGELRFDRSDQNVFRDKDGVTAKSSQNSIGLEALYKF